MSLVKFFISHPCPLENKKADENTLSLLEVEVSTFMLQLDIEAIRVDGPYVSNVGNDEVVYSASVMYNKIES